MENKIRVPATRTCPECEMFGLVVLADESVFVCKICGAIWELVEKAKEHDMS